MTKSHDQEMRDVYAHIYQDRYAFSPEAMAQVRERISKNLTEFSIQADDLARMNVLNVGPSREALAFHELGAKNIFHFDISDVAVRSIHRAQEKSPRLGNIQSVQRDLCAPGALPIKEEIDFVYLSGVLHHLRNPSQALANIFPYLGENARLFFRIYRSGSMAYFCADFIRRFIGYDDRDTVDAVFRKLTPVPTAEENRLYVGMWDDFFVPVLLLFDPNAVDSFFAGHGFTVAVPHNHVPYDHENSRNDGQGISLFYAHAGGRLGQVAPGSFPGHVDQLTDIAYREDYILRTVSLMRSFIERAPDLPSEVKAEVAIKVFRLGRLRNFTGSHLGERHHHKIQTILEDVIAPDNVR